MRNNAADSYNDAEPGRAESVSETGEISQIRCTGGYGS